MKMAFKTRQVVNLITIFILGIAVGVSINSIRGYCHSGGFAQHSDQEKLDFFSKKLDLSAEQKEQVRIIFKSHREELEKLHNNIQTNFTEIREKIASEIRLILNPEQQVRYERFREHMQKKGRFMRHYSPSKFVNE